MLAVSIYFYTYVAVNNKTEIIITCIFFITSNKKNIMPVIKCILFTQSQYSTSHIITDNLSVTTQN